MVEQRLTADEVLATGHDWYHTVDLGDGVSTPGRVDLRPYVVHAHLPEDMSGTRVLDVGTFDGFWAFEFERRGASVVAIDTAEIPWPDTPRKHAHSIEPSQADTGFRRLHDYFESSIDYRTVAVSQLTPEAVGAPFDLAFVGAILLHLQNPLGALERVRSTLLPGGRVIVMEPVDAPLTDAFPDQPLARWEAERLMISLWYPNDACLRAWVATAGFVDIEMGAQVWFTDTSGNRKLTQTVFATNPLVDAG